MLFDSEELIKLAERYAHCDYLSLPLVLRLAQNSSLENERRYLEEIFLLIPQSKRKKFINNFASQKNGQHLGSWFELQLLGWLTGFSNVEFEPIYKGDLPDFKVKIKDKVFYIEATAAIIDDRERKKNIEHIKLLNMFQQIQKSFIIKIETYDIGYRPLTRDIVSEVSMWLENSPEKNFLFEDYFGNKIELSAILNKSSEKVFVIGPTESIWINPFVLNNPLKGKATKNKMVRYSTYPYLIAIFLESPLLHAEDVVNAWFGNIQVKFDPDKKVQVSSTIDKTGLHFFKNRILHTSISATLVFKSFFDEENKRRELKPWYIQNPYAKSPFYHELLPIKSKFLIDKYLNNTFTMSWKENK